MPSFEQHGLAQQRIERQRGVRRQCRDAQPVARLDGFLAMQRFGQQDVGAQRRVQPQHAARLREARHEGLDGCGG
jgi:hypothetical protein